MAVLKGLSSLQFGFTIRTIGGIQALFYIKVLADEHHWLERYQNDRLTRPIEIVREAVRQVRQVRSFHVDAGVMLPDHLHCLSTLPLGDDDLPTRWRLIKTLFVKRLAKTEPRSTVRESRGERGNLATTLLGTRYSG